MSKGFQLEAHMHIYNNDDGSYIDVAPDADGLGLIAIDRVDHEGKRHFHFTITAKEAELLVKALQQVVVSNPGLIDSE